MYNERNSLTSMHKMSQDELTCITIINMNNLQLYRIKYYYLIQMNFKQIYLTHKWGSPG